MDLKITKDQLRDNPYRLLRKFGYGFIRDRRSGSESMVRRLGRGFYPRFHMYVKEEGEEVVFSLHLDQQQATHYSQHRHNAEYDSEPVQQEIERLKKFIYSNPPQENSPDQGSSSEKSEKKGWLARLFGKS